MRFILVLVLVTILYSCSPKTYVYIADENKFGDVSDGLSERDSTITVFFESGKINAVGKLAVTNDSLLSHVKTGFWREYSESGNLKSEGNYRISSYLNCGVAGPFREYYSYKSGKWKYYNEQGELVYEVEFEPTIQNVKTNCEGGDSLTFGLIKDIPLKYINKLTPEVIFKLQQVTLEENNTTLIYTPLNGEVHITFDPDIQKSKL